MAEWKSLTDAAREVGVSRITLGRWARRRRLKTRRATVPNSNLQAVLVNLKQVRAIVGKGLKPGRPAGGKSNRGKGRRR
jgi:hypothetical protein